MAQEPIIQAKALSKEFMVRERLSGEEDGVRSRRRKVSVRRRVVDRVDIDIFRGEVVGFLGPNGAGKSTTIKMLTGILVPTSGDVRVAGLIPWRKRSANARNIGVVFGHRTQLWTDLPLEDSLVALGKLYGMSSSAFDEAMTRLGDLLDLRKFLQTRVRALSLGQRMRGDIAAAMLHSPDILFLDEPTVGLDAVAKARIREFIRREARERGTTVLLTTHDMDDVDALCDRVLIVDHGQIIYRGSIERLRSKVAPYQDLLVTVRGGVPMLDTLPAAVVSSETRGTESHIVYRFDPSTISTPELVEKIGRACDVKDLRVREPRTDDVVQSIYAISRASGPGVMVDDA